MSQNVLISLDSNDVKKVALKLHKQFGHPTSSKLINLIKKAGISNEKLIDEVNKVSNTCIICRKFRKPVSKPVVALPIASKFNEVISMDLKIWGNKYFLVMIDVATRYCTATVINNKLASTVITAIFLHWIVLFGAPKKILSDNGGEFNNEEMRALGEAFNIRIMNTAAESPWSNGICERQNAVIGDSVRKIIADTKCSVEVALAWAIAARNCLTNNSGFSPNQLVFGQNPVLPNVFSNKPPALNVSIASDLVRDNLNAMHSARQEFVKFESNEKLQRALRHNIRATEASLIENGDQVFYKRNDGHEWHGPGTVIGRDGKQFLVRHGGVYVRVHECRLSSVPLNIENRDPIQGEVDISNFRKQPGALQSRSVSESGGNDEESAYVESDSETTEVFPDSNENNLLTNNASIVHGSNDQLQSNNGMSEQNRVTITEKPIKVKVGQRIKGIQRDSGEIMCGKLVSRAGKATGKFKNCFNMQKDSDGTVEWFDLKKDFLEFEIIDDDVELVVFFNSEEVICAKEKEIDSWKQNDVYEEMEDLGQETISVRWVITEKLRENAPIIKARLVARGFEENTCELDKHSPTCSKEAVRLALSIASSNSWDCHTLDVKSAFLQGNQISRNVFLKPPPEYNNGKLWRLKKTVYGLSDAARQWYLRVKEELVKLGVTISKLDPALFSWHENGRLCGIICLYVDDFLWAGTPSFEVNVIEKLSGMFLIGSSGYNAFKYIGLNVISVEGHTTVDQFDYARSLKPVTISRQRMNDKYSDLSENEKADYRALVGQLNWIATQTRPDIAYDVCELSVSLNKANVNDLIRLNKVILRVTTDNMRLYYPKMQSLRSCTLECFSDASFANLPDCKSQGGFVIFLKDANSVRCPIFWKSRKIRRVVKSTLAAETLALVDCAEAAIYIRKILKELCNCENVPINCHVDNKSLIDALNSKKNVEDKRLRIDLAVLEDMLLQKEINSVSWVNTSNQLADCLTKRGASAQQLRAAISRD